MQTRRIIMTIHRGPMDATAVCVYPWEKPLLEEIHPGGANEKSIEEMCAMHGPVSVKRQKLPFAADGKKAYAPDLREQLQKMCSVDPEDDPVQDPAAEFSRLSGKYGMHPEVKLLTVEKVYHSEAMFRRMLRDYANAATIDEANDAIPSRGPAPDRSESAEPEAEKPVGPSVGEMNRAELLALLKKEGVAIPQHAKTEMLREIATQAVV